MLRTATMINTKLGLLGLLQFSIAVFHLGPVFLGLLRNQLPSTCEVSLGDMSSHLLVAESAESGGIFRRCDEGELHDS